MRALFVLLFTAATLSAQQTDPHLEHRGQTTQLIVDGKPYVMLSGELHNSSSSSLDYMKPAWPQLAKMGLNTVVTPLSWELIEPAEGKYDFTLVDGLLEQAREQHLRVVFLWLAAWKNGVSSYPPVWVRENVGKYPRAMQDGRPTNTLSVLYPALREADARAFQALMEHIKSVDGQQHTVLMMHVENEVGILGSSRDHSAEADKLFAGAVPEELLRSIAAHRETLNPEFRALWEANGAKTHGTWAEVFGDTVRADEIFMAWHYALYLNAVAAAGKSAYGIPMYANAWLGGGDAKPGDYPSGGPQPRVLDVWKAAGRVWIWNRRICMRRILRVGANGIIGRIIRCLFRRRIRARWARRMCFTRWASRRRWGSARSGSIAGCMGMGRGFRRVGARTR